MSLKSPKLLPSTQTLHTLMISIGNHHISANLEWAIERGKGFRRQSIWRLFMIKSLQFTHDASSLEEKSCTLKQHWLPVQSFAAQTTTAMSHKGPFDLPIVSCFVCNAVIGKVCDKPVELLSLLFDTHLLFQLFFCQRKICCAIIGTFSHAFNIAICK